jgi:SAM-dependent methyltransferase/uncharacterized protein YbaR (Trm112 family)
MNTLDPWFIDNLVCPVDGGALRWEPQTSLLHSATGRVYPVVDGVPVMLPAEVEPTLSGMKASRDCPTNDAPWYLSSVLLSDEEKSGIQQLIKDGSAVDPVATYLVAATNGIGYKHLIGSLKEYPIPEIRLPEGNGKTLLDVGCSWGRWCVASARKGYQPIGMDPSLGAVMAARRVAKALGANARFMVGDARHLPLRDGCIDTSFSYSVLQHLSEEDATQSIRHIGRALRPGGDCLVQMPTKWGLRCLMNQARRKFRRAEGFEVRYWTLADLRKVFREAVGPCEISVDCFFGIGWQPTDLPMMPSHFKLVIHASEALRIASKVLPQLKWVADSVYVSARKGDKA